MFGFAVLLTRAHLRAGIFNMSVKFQSFIEIYILYGYIEIVVFINKKISSFNYYGDTRIACY